MRVLLAGRLSQLQSGQTGMESREAEMIKWAEANGHDRIAITEDWQSGTTPLTRRPDLKPWVTDPAKLAQFDALVVYEASRLSRGPKAMTNEIESWATANGKQIMTVREGLRYPCEGTDGIYWDVTHRVNHQQWLDTSRMYRNMHTWLRDNGYLVGRPPYGYVVTCAEGCAAPHKEHHKTITPDETLAPVVREMFERYARGGSLTDICVWLDNAGISPQRGGIWQQKCIATMFRNPTYMGRRQDSDGRTILKVDPIVDAALWRRVNDRMDSSPRKRGKLGHETAFLTGILFCGKCSGPMYRITCQTRRGDGTKYSLYYYRCKGTNRVPSQCRNMIPLTQLDVLAAGIMMQCQEPVTERIYIPGGNQDAALETLRMDMRSLAAADLPDEEYDARLKALRTERDRLQSLPSMPDRTELRETGETVAGKWAAADRDSRRAMMLSRVRIFADSATFPQLRFESDYNLNTLSEVDAA